VNRHEQSLQQRRLELVERSSAQRAAIGAQIAPLVQKTATMDRAMASVRRYPMVSGLIAGAVMLFGSRKIFSLVVRGITLYTLLRKL
jgi:hypothetical protein